MQYHAIQPRQDTSYAPHSLTYVVTKDVGAAVSVCQQFKVNGILSCYGDQIKSRDVSFTLVAESGKSMILSSFHSLLLFCFLHSSPLLFSLSLSSQVVTSKFYSSPAVVLRVARSKCCHKNWHSTKLKWPSNLWHISSVHTVEPYWIMIGYTLKHAANPFTKLLHIFTELLARQLKYKPVQVKNWTDCKELY